MEVRVSIDLNPYKERVSRARVIKPIGKVTRVIGLMIEVQGITARIGEVCDIVVQGEPEPVRAEVVGFRDQHSLLMPLGELRGIFPGCAVVPTGHNLRIRVGRHLYGQVLDGLGRPIDSDFDCSLGEDFPVDNRPPNPLKRKRIDTVLPTGVRAIDALLTCGKGQRIGIFAGSGVGKSTLLGMIARHGSADVNVIGLIGERGREVLEFLQEDLGPEGMARSIIVAATSDQPALVRLKGAFVATAIAEYFRDQGLDVMLMMDSVTRFAMAQREVGLAVGEPPATKGYTPSVFALLPKLLERSGMGQRGSITAFYTVLVDGDDLNEPIADTVRGILDGHIVLSRKLASSNHYPAIDVLQSVSRLMPDITSEEHQAQASLIKDLMAVYRQSEDLINIGAYAAGSNPKIDRAIAVHDNIENFLKQSPLEYSGYEETLNGLAILAGGK
ncbi:flagellar protein export ATPase FliI [Desulforamulus ferrireducens]|uniref:Flagellar protein export ATPase FliI n=1 Tax=Desulforamulus ferrireducens TaxID=1833852 RepID=A0A1S6IYI2_9FIRM|nr:flagellar protein export ATPase FliI [Desulforamulus ferrireducens]AQS59821.1 flagellar protein export ATPase FliI [Desulforamulus ferrireducens]